MITCSVALKAHLASPSQTTCTCWLAIRIDGTIVGFTEHDQDISFNLEAWMISVGLPVVPQVEGTGLVTYHAASGYTRTDIVSNSTLEVDNLEAAGPLVLPSMVEDDVRAGIWDFSSFTIFLVNWADLTMGALIQRCGKIGEITIERGKFKAAMGGVSDAYKRTLGQLTSPTCRTTLGSSLCKIDLSLFTVTGSVEGVSTDNRTIYDSARTEAGPGQGSPPLLFFITDITQANPGVVTLSTTVTLLDGAAITISGVVGMEEVNTTTVVHNPSGMTFEIGDTSGFTAYVSDGTVTPLGADSGYFDNGVITFTSGPNDGLSMEVESYVPGQITLQLPMPYPFVIGSPSSTYSMHAGCDYSFATCKARFNNVLNFRGEPYLPGIDKLVQQGKQ